MGPIIQQHARCHWCSKSTIITSREDADIWLRSHKCSQRCDDVFTTTAERHICVRKTRHVTDHKCSCGKKWGG